MRKQLTHYPKKHIRRILKARWIRACRWDSMPIDTVFAQFSDDNPHARRHENLVRLLFAVQAKNRAS